MKIWFFFPPLFCVVEQSGKTWHPFPSNCPTGTVLYCPSQSAQTQPHSLMTSQSEKSVYFLIPVYKSTTTSTSALAPTLIAREWRSEEKEAVGGVDIMTLRPSFLLIAFVFAIFVVDVVESDEVRKERPTLGHRSGGSSEVGSTTNSRAILYRSDDDFHLWMKAHSKRYASPDHRAAAERTWRANKAWAFASNDAKTAAGSNTLSVDGPFADLTYDEFVRKILSTSNFSNALEQRRDIVVASSSSSSVPLIWSKRRSSSSCAANNASRSLTGILK